jgi:hypothetical protein
MMGADDGFSEIPPVANQGFKRKLWKPNKSLKKLLLGSDVGLEETRQMALCGLVGCIYYHYLAQEPL